MLLRTGPLVYNNKRTLSVSITRGSYDEDGHSSVLPIMKSKRNMIYRMMFEPWAMNMMTAMKTNRSMMRSTTIVTKRVINADGKHESIAILAG